MQRALYLGDTVLQRAVERTFMNLIQSCIDLSQHIRASEDLSPQGTSKAEIEALEKKRHHHDGDASEDI
ncbi:HepT-like ribonuclease domain-containing protein [Haloarcula salina]|uniref:HepT-like ribonuclease domain-containing protein n=1 Tax=Haloarcula salina TaxID=1429914 RepID=UPI003460727D